MSSRRHTDVEVTTLGMLLLGCSSHLKVETNDFMTDAAILAVVADTTGARGIADASTMSKPYKCIVTGVENGLDR